MLAFHATTYRTLTAGLILLAALCLSISGASAQSDAQQPPPKKKTETPAKSGDTPVGGTRSIRNMGGGDQRGAGGTERSKSSGDERSSGGVERAKSKDQ